MVDKTRERVYEAEVYRIKGTLTLQLKVESGEWKIEEAEGCFLKAIEIAQRQQTKSLELRATTSLVRLRQQQAAQDASRDTQNEARIRLDEAPHDVIRDLRLVYRRV